MSEVFTPAHVSKNTLLHTSALKGFLIGAAVGLAVCAFAVSVVLSGGMTLAAGCLIVGAGVASVGVGAELGGIIGRSSKSAKGDVTTGSSNVFYGSERFRAARAVTDTVLCKKHGIKQIAVGAETVLINGMPAARQAHKTVCDGELDSKVTNVFIGGPSVQLLEIDGEIPGWMHNVAQGFIIVGTTIAFSGAGVIGAFGRGLWFGVQALGVVGLEFLGGWLAGKYSEELGQYLEDQYGLPSWTSDVFGVVGAIGGSILAGKAGNSAINSINQRAAREAAEAADNAAVAGAADDLDNVGTTSPKTPPNGGATVKGLDDIPDGLASPSKARSELDAYIKGNNPDRPVSVATAEVTVNGQTKRYVAVSGKSLKADAPDFVTIDGKQYQVVRTDAGSVAPDPINPNYNHAEQKLFSHIQNQHAGQNAKVNVGVENTSASRPGMCPGCSNTSQNFAKDNPGFDVTVYEGSTGTGK